MNGQSRWLAGVIAGALLILPVADPAVAADPSCKEYNDRGVCLIGVDRQGEKPREVVSRDKSNNDEAPRYPDCPEPGKGIFEGDGQPVPEGWVRITCWGTDIIGEGLHQAWVEPRVDPERLARSLLAQVELKPIAIGLVPKDPAAMTVVGLPVWLWVDEPTRTTWGPATIAAGGVSLTATVESVTWEMGDGTTVKCGKGTEWKRGMGADPSPTCGHTYVKQGSYTIRARSHWVARWSGYGQSGTIPVTLSTTRQLDVGEIQVIATGG
ncbi:MAG: hypothetical protein KIT69_00260 [Propionibacteriaceae bacterium]|nr:hypothetical protein [Propionibacteriaceae bacterium]